MEAPASNIEMATIYIRLLDEGAEAFRPTLAEPSQDGLFKVLPTANYNTQDETWEFVPGLLVECEKREMQGEVVLVAVKAHYDASPK